MSLNSKGCPELELKPVISIFFFSFMLCQAKIPRPNKILLNLGGWNMNFVAWIPL